MVERKVRKVLLKQAELSYQPIGLYRFLALQILVYTFSHLKRPFFFIFIVKIIIVNYLETGIDYSNPLIYDIIDEVQKQQKLYVKYLSDPVAKIVVIS